jgi:hypothetical protein
MGLNGMLVEYIVCAVGALRPPTSGSRYVGQQTLGLFSFWY